MLSYVFEIWNQKVLYFERFNFQSLFKFMTGINRTAQVNIH